MTILEPAKEDSGDCCDIEQMFAAMAEATAEATCRQWRVRIIEAALPLADNIAYRFVGRGEPGEDLVQVARLGLVKTVDRYEPGKGPFLGFAIATIAGEVRRHFRDNTWAMHVPRKVKDNHRRVHVAAGQLSQRLGRPPTVGELAAELGINREDVARCLNAVHAYRPLPLEAALAGHGEGWTLGSRHGAVDPRYERIEDCIALAAALTGLGDRDRDIIRMRFGECLTQTEIADRLGISQVHVSRLLIAVLQRLRAEIGPGATDADAIRGLAKMAALQSDVDEAAARRCRTDDARGATAERRR